MQLREREREKDKIQVKVNEVICYKEVLVIYSEFNYYSDLKMVLIDIPKYVINSRLNIFCILGKNL